MKQIKPPPSLSFKFFFLYFWFLLSILVFFTSGTVESEDGWLYLGVARNIYYNHSFTAPPNEYNSGKNVNMNSILMEDGSWRPPGGYAYSLALVPAVFLSDIYHNYTDTPVPEYFPLETDWSLLFFASFTSIFFLSFTGVILLYYLLVLGFSQKTSLLFSLLLVFCTNLFPLATFGFTQLLFTTFLLLSFLFIKLNQITTKKRYIVGLALSFTIVALSYNYSFVLTIPALFLYYLLLHKKLFDKKLWFLLFIGLIILTLTASSVDLPRFLHYFLRAIPKILVESIWGFLFSFGKSIFIYSPLLILPAVFWQNLKESMVKAAHKNRSAYNRNPEIISFILLFVSYLIFYGLFYLDKAQNGLIPIWYGGAVWGPRYIAPTIPFLLILTAVVYTDFSRFGKKILLWLFIPISLYLQLLGVLVPYQVQYRGLPYNIFVNNQEILQYEYAAFFPRYSPLFTMTRDLLQKIATLPETFSRGAYQTRLYDGFDYPMKTSLGKVRPFSQQAHISWKNIDNKPQTIELTLINGLDGYPSTQSAQLLIAHNENTLLETTLEPGKTTNLQLKTSDIKKQEKLDLFASFADPTIEQKIFVTSLKIAGTPVNLNEISIPYVDHTSAPKNSQLSYQYYGKVVTQPWKLWYARSRVYEESFSLWWIRNRYYWDIPQHFVSVLFICFVLQLTLTSYILHRYIKNEKLS